MSDIIKRCFGGPGQELYTEYHDSEWGMPSYNDQHLFEMLALSGAQAGLSWQIIFKKRASYRDAFHQFDPNKVSVMSDEELDSLIQNSTIIRNRLKIYSVRKNARVFLRIQQEFGSFSRYLWNFVDHKPIKNSWRQFKEVPTRAAISDLVSKDLKKRGIAFIGPVSMYSFMQSVGIINDHLVDCWCYDR